MLFKTLLNAVGNGLQNEPDDVVNVKSALSDEGFFDMEDKPEEPHGILTSTLDSGIKRFQRDKGLKEDGLLFPGGETETALKREKPTRKGLFSGVDNPLALNIQERKLDEDKSIKYDATGRMIGAAEERRLEMVKRQKEVVNRTAFKGLITDVLLQQEEPNISESEHVLNKIIIPDEKPFKPEFRKIIDKKIDDFERDDLKQSLRFFNNFLKGKGTPIQITSQEMDNYNIFRKSIHENRKRFEDSMVKSHLMKADHEFKNKILSLKDGETIVLNKEGGKNNKSKTGDFWDRDIQFYEGVLNKDNDQSMSIGSVKLRSNGSFRATRNGDVVKIEGVVDNRINDIYNFNDKTVFDKIFLKNFKQIELETKAKPFRVFGSKPEKLEGMIRIKNGEIKNSKFKWQDIEK